MGHRDGRHALYTLVPTPHRGHRRETRRLRGARRQGWYDRRLRRQTPCATRARRLLVPQRRHPLHLRSPRLLCVGSRQPRLHHRRHADDSHRLHQLHRRSPRLQSPAQKVYRRSKPRRRSRLHLLLRPTRARTHQPRLGTRVLPRRRRPLRRAPRPIAHRTHPHGARQRQESADGRPLFRCHPRARGRIHARSRNTSPPSRHSLQDAPQRSGPQPV